MEQKQREFGRTWIRLPERGGRGARHHDQRDQAQRRVRMQPKIGRRVRGSLDAEHGVAADGVVVAMVSARLIVVRMWVGLCSRGAERQLTNVTEEGEKDEDQNEGPGSM